MELDNINSLEPIPMLRPIGYRDCMIGGHKVRVHAPTGRQACIAATRFGETFGDTLLRIFATPEKKNGGVDILTLLKSRAGTAEIMKAVIMTGFIPMVVRRMRDAGETISEEHMWFYFETLLPGNVELEGVRLHDMDQFDKAGFSLIELYECFIAAIEVALYPTQGGLPTSTGSPQPSPNTSPEPPESEPPTASSTSDAITKAGHSVLTPG